LRLDTALRLRNENKTNKQKLLGEKVAEPTRNSTSRILRKPTEKQRSPFISTPYTTSGLSISRFSHNTKVNSKHIFISDRKREKWAEWNWCCLRNTAMWPLFSFSTAFSTSGWLPKLAKPANSNSTIPPQIFCCCCFCFCLITPMLFLAKAIPFVFLWRKFCFCCKSQQVQGVISNPVRFRI
jgi:hypothetical protein